MDIPWLYCNFNSSVVRLKVKITIMNLVILKFQFQCGAIKSIVVVIPSIFVSTFQFQCGAIKR